MNNTDDTNTTDLSHEGMIAVQAAETAVEAAINSSTARYEIVSIDWSRDREDALLAQADGWENTVRRLESWGTTEDADGEVAEWRVHLTRRAEVVS